MRVLGYAAILLFDAPREHMLLLKRSNDKKLYPGRLSGIGGKLERDETPLQCLMREVREEAPQIDWDAIAVTHRLTLRDIWEGEEHRMDWYTGMLNRPPEDLSSEEGELIWQRTVSLPPVAEWTPSAYVVTAHLLAHPDAAAASATLDDRGTLPFMRFTR